MNAFFVVVMDVSSFVVTLGMGTLLIGLAQVVSGRRSSRSAARRSVRSRSTRCSGMPISFYYGIVLAVVIAYVLGWTPFGRGMLFVGASPEVGPARRHPRATDPDRVLPDRRAAGWDSPG